ncbi:ATP-binding protein, partial [Acinetobacter pittii]
MKVEVSPDMQFYNLLEGYPYNPTIALCEYIDNALQAYKNANLLNEKNKLELDLEFIQREKESFIIIRDYGVGISQKDIQRAFKPGYRPSSQSLNEFGIGMKAASLWFCRSWELVSFPKNSKTSLTVAFDLDSLISSNSSEIEVVSQTRSKEERSGVKITLKQLRRDLSQGSVSTIYRELQEIYQIFIQREKVLKLCCKYNGTALLGLDSEALKFTPDVEVLNYPKTVLHKTKPYSYGKEKKWIQEIDFEFEGRKVTGFLLVLKTASQINNPGLRLFRFKRLIRGSSHQPYRPINLLGTPNKHAPSRVYGEIHLDGQSISTHKSNFQFDEAFFLDTLSQQPGIQELLDQAENYRAKEADKGGIKHFNDEQEYLDFVKKKSKPG